MHKFKFIAATLILLVPLAGFAQTRQALVTPEHNIEAARKQMRTERKLVLAGELVLTPDESKAFWPLYNDYAAEIRKIGDERVRMIVEYAEMFDNITPDYADRMLKEYFDIEQRLLQTRKNYVKRFKTILPSVKVARLYQVENKLNAIMNIELAAAIPIIGTGASQAN
ncbi:MAG: hypothetical protein E2O52_07990 [Gammaproteobacteria bacterium]|nr:MAG: hypothetical protein E2O52_07990 [Gammaproteobacteria bacterium]